MKVHLPTSDKKDDSDKRVYSRSLIRTSHFLMNNRYSLGKGGRRREDGHADLRLYRIFMESGVFFRNAAQHFKLLDKISECIRDVINLLHSCKSKIKYHLKYIWFISTLTDCQLHRIHNNLNDK